MYKPRPKELTNALVSVRGATPHNERGDFDEIVKQIIWYASDAARKRLANMINWYAQENIINDNGLLVMSHEIFWLTDRLNKYATDVRHEKPTNDVDPRIFSNRLNYELVTSHGAEFVISNANVNDIVKCLIQDRQLKSHHDKVTRARIVHANLDRTLRLIGAHATDCYQYIFADDTMRNDLAQHFAKDESTTAVSLTSLNRIARPVFGRRLFTEDMLSMTSTIEETPSMMTSIALSFLNGVNQILIDDKGHVV